MDDNIGSQPTQCDLLAYWQQNTNIWLKPNCVTKRIIASAGKGWGKNCGSGTESGLTVVDLGWERDDRVWDGNGTDRCGLGRE